MILTVYTAPAMRVLALAAYPVLKSFHVRLTQSIDTDGKESDDSEWSSCDEDAAENADEDEEVDVERHYTCTHLSIRMHGYVCVSVYYCE